MIGLDFPVKPEWIHDVHHLWRPNQPISELVQAALIHTMQELGGEKTRRNSLGIILRYFVETEGGGKSRRTVSQDVWVAYSLAYPVNMMAPAYLAHLMGQNEVAQEIGRFLTRRHSPGDTFSSTEVRQHVSLTFGQRKVVTNAASAFLRTLDAFGVIVPGRQKGAYQWATQLSVAKEVFPLVVWTWWQVSQSPQIDLAAFAGSPALAFLEADNFFDHWTTYQPTLWAIDERLEGRRATLKHVEADFFAGTLFQLLPK
jgi:hypothetical protein